MENPNDKESAWAGVLTGTMIALLGCAFPGLAIWGLVAGGEHSPIRSAQDVTDGLQAVSIGGFSLAMLWYGVRLARHNVNWLRRR